MTTPAYNIVTQTTIDISNNSMDEILAITQDLNNKGYVVYINGHNMVQKGFGVFNGCIVKDCKIPPDDEMVCDGNIQRYFEDEYGLICVKQTAQQLKKLKSIRSPIFIGNTDSGEYKINLEWDGLKIGCQRISKRAAILIARKILKEYNERL